MTCPDDVLGRYNVAPAILAFLVIAGGGLMLRLLASRRRK
jgi:hypothetical protein